MEEAGIWIGRRGGAHHLVDLVARYARGGTACRPTPVILWCSGRKQCQLVIGDFHLPRSDRYSVARSKVHGYSRIGDPSARIRVVFTSIPIALKKEPYENVSYSSWPNRSARSRASWSIYSLSGIASIVVSRRAIVSTDETSVSRMTQGSRNGGSHPPMKIGTVSAWKQSPRRRCGSGPG